MKFIPISKRGSLNKKILANPECIELIRIFRDLYLKVGYEKPWTGYFAMSDNNEIVGVAGFKGKPKNGKVEISYGTFKNYRRQGIGTMLCHQLVSLALQQNKKIGITARTLPENNASTKILEKNRFNFSALVWDEDDGNVWEWKYKHQC